MIRDSQIGFLPFAAIMICAWLLLLLIDSENKARIGEIQKLREQVSELQKRAMPEKYINER